jgi:hypothetical protein
MWNHVLLPSNQICAGRLGMCDAAAYARAMHICSDMAMATLSPPGLCHHSPHVERMIMCEL